jgi:1,4-alpha-glucan branching enzyme
MSQPPDTSVPALAPDDLWRFGEGTHDGLAYLMGAHVDPDGTTFRVWAPSARSVSVIGEFNGWTGDGAELTPSPAGIWSGRLAEARAGSSYKYRIVTASGAALDKSDPFGFAAEEPPRTASVIADLDYEWGDGDWMTQRAERNRFDAPISIYEVHLGSWRYEPGGYRALAVQLADHLERTGFTHVELMPVMEHPFYGSWGYQTTGYFAPTARYGSPQDFMFLIDHLHQRGFGVVLDWVPSHFPVDAHGLAEFDGSHLYEHADPRLGFHPDWTSAIFNYDRHEVRSFLLSSARFWVERYHADGMRVDAVASMLYRDYSRAAGEWIPNEHGGRENLGATAFLQEFNRRVYLHHPDTFTVAEESTAWPGVTHPTDGGGLGFGYKWDMGWMNDTLEYLRRDPVHRRWHYGELTFRTVYAFHESFVLPLSHDEVVHGKGSLLTRQPGDRWQQFAGLRLLFGYQYGQPGKKLLFMGSELGMAEEWNHERELPWDLLQHAEHAGILDWVAALNHLHRDEPALHRCDNTADGFRWVIGNDDANSIVAFLRLATGHRPVLVVCNFTAVPRNGYRIGVPDAGRWTTLLNGDDHRFGGSGVGAEFVDTEDVAAHGHDRSLTIDVPPLAVCFLAPA